jgi:hypothetical protein
MFHDTFLFSSPTPLQELDAKGKVPTAVSFCKSGPGDREAGPTTAQLEHNDVRSSPQEVLDARLREAYERELREARGAARRERA